MHLRYSHQTVHRHNNSLRTESLSGAKSQGNKQLHNVGAYWPLYQLSSKPLKKRFESLSAFASYLSQIITSQWRHMPERCVCREEEMGDVQALKECQLGKSYSKVPRPRIVDIRPPLQSKNRAKIPPCVRQLPRTREFTSRLFNLNCAHMAHILRLGIIQGFSEKAQGVYTINLQITFEFISAVYLYLTKKLFVSSNQRKPSIPDVYVLCRGPSNDSTCQKFGEHWAALD